MTMARSGDAPDKSPKSDNLFILPFRFQAFEKSAKPLLLINAVVHRAPTFRLFSDEVINAPFPNNIRVFYRFT